MCERKCRKAAYLVVVVNTDDGTYELLRNESVQTTELIFVFCCLFLLITPILPLSVKMARFVSVPRVNAFLPYLKTSSHDIIW